MTTLVFWFLLAAIVGWFGAMLWLPGRHRWRLDVLAWVGVLGLPVLVAYLGARGRWSVPGCILAALLWLAFAALLWRVRRLPARPAAAGGGRRTPW